MTEPTVRIQHNNEKVFLVFKDVKGRELEFEASDYLARQMGEALFKTGCKVKALREAAESKALEND